MLRPRRRQAGLRNQSQLLGRSGVVPPAGGPLDRHLEETRADAQQQSGTAPIESTPTNEGPHFCASSVYANTAVAPLFPNLRCWSPQPIFFAATRSALVWVLSKSVFAISKSCRGLGEAMGVLQQAEANSAEMEISIESLPILKTAVRVYLEHALLGIALILVLRFDLVADMALQEVGWWMVIILPIMLLCIVMGIVVPTALATASFQRLLRSSYEASMATMGMAKQHYRWHHEQQVMAAWRYAAAARTGRGLSTADGATADSQETPVVPLQPEASRLVAGIPELLLEARETLGRIVPVVDGVDAPKWADARLIEILNCTGTVTPMQFDAFVFRSIREFFTFLDNILAALAVASPCARINISDTPTSKTPPLPVPDFAVGSLCAALQFLYLRLSSMLTIALVLWRVVRGMNALLLNGQIQIYHTWTDAERQRPQANRPRVSAAASQFHLMENAAEAEFALSKSLGIAMAFCRLGVLPRNSSGKGFRRVSSVTRTELQMLAHLIDNCSRECRHLVDLYDQHSNSPKERLPRAEAPPSLPPSASEQRLVVEYDCGANEGPEDDSKYQDDDSTNWEDINPDITQMQAVNQELSVVLRQRRAAQEESAARSPLSNPISEVPIQRAVDQPPPVEEIRSKEGHESTSMEAQESSTTNQRSIASKRRIRKKGKSSSTADAVDRMSDQRQKEKMGEICVGDPVLTGPRSANKPSQTHRGGNTISDTSTTASSCEGSPLPISTEASCEIALWSTADKVSRKEGTGNLADDVNGENRTLQRSQLVKPFDEGPRALPQHVAVSIGHDDKFTLLKDLQKAILRRATESCATES